ncbi:MAG: TlpA family protein disulfide reductase [Candidatus Thorarchaeota archaeon]
MQKERALIVIVISSTVVIGLAVGFLFINSPGEGIVKDTDLLDRGIQPPDWTLTMSDGSTTSLHSYRGRFLIVDLMATWCTTCEAENAELEAIYDNMGDSIWLISLTVDFSETEAMMADYKAQKNLPWPHGLDTNGVFGNYFNVIYIPSIVIIDDAGYLRWFHEGFWGESSMNETLTQLM